MIQLLWENEQSALKIEDDLIDALKQCMEKTLEYEEFPENAQISLTFTDNAGIHECNLKTRGIDRPTDVLSFPLLECEDDGTLILYDEDFSGDYVMLGDILISTEKAIEQASSFGHSLLRELSFLTVHSMLHLLGYDHERGEKEEKEMFDKQEEILSSLGITR